MVKTRVFMGIAVIVVLGLLMMLYIYRGLGDVTGYLAKLDDVEIPFSIAAIEMEKNAGEYALGTLRYVAYPRPDIRAEVGNDSADYARYHASYTRLSSTGEERAFGRRLAADYRGLTVAGEALMDQRDRLDSAFERISGVLEEFDVLIDSAMLRAVPDREPARSRTLAAIANMEAEAAEIGFWLAVFERRPTPVARQRIHEKVDELDDAIAGYRRLPGSAQERRLGAEAMALHGKAGKGIDGLLAGEDDLARRVDAFIRMQFQLDEIFDRNVLLLAQEGLTQPQIDANDAVELVRLALRYMIPLYVVAALAVGVLLILTIVRPLGRLASGTKAIAAGNLEYRVAERGRDEFAELARQFNAMVERLQESTVSKGLLEVSERKLRQTVSELREEIAERQRAERQREKLQGELQRSTAMAAMGTLVAGVAHEVRNPLFGISSTLDAMEANPGKSSVDGRYRDVLRREVGRLNKLMVDLLEYGRPPASELAPQPVGPVIAEAIRTCNASAQTAGVAIAGEGSADGDLVRMNRDRLLQVFVNLIENAAQHAPEGSRVTVATTATTDDSGNRWLACSVRDSGAGFAEADLALIFDPFFTRRRNGTGLGLAIVQRIVEEHGGTITPGNHPEGGAVVTVRLPVAGSGQAG